MYYTIGASMSSLHRECRTLVYTFGIINPRRACAGGLLYLSCVSVMTFSATSFVSTLESRYVRVDYRLFLIFEKLLPRTLTHLSTYVHLYCCVYLYYITLYIHAEGFAL